MKKLMKRQEYNKGVLNMKKRLLIVPALVLVLTLAIVMIVSASVAADPVYYNITVNQSIYGCCDVTINGTPVPNLAEDTNVSVEGNTTFPINATYNGSCNWFWEWYDFENSRTHLNVTDPYAINTTMNISDNTSLSGICDYFPTPAPVPTSAPVLYGEVNPHDQMLVGFPYQRQSFVAEDLFWAFYLDVLAGDGGALCYRTSADGTNWSDQTELLDYTSDYIGGYNYNGSSFSLWYDDTYDTVDIAFVNFSTLAGGGTLVYLRGTPLANGTLVESDAGWQVVISEETSHFVAPSVCTNTTGYPFIGLTMANSLAGPDVALFHSETNNGTWTEHFGFPMLSMSQGYGGDDDQYISVIPVTAGNVSVQYASLYSLNGGNYYMAQNYISHDGAGTWTKGDADWVSAVYPVESWSPWLVGPYHSEVHVSTAYNVDDIFMVWTSWDEGGPILMFDTANDPAFIWSNGYEAVLALGGYVAAMSISNVNGDIVLTLNGMYGDQPLYTMPYDTGTETWGLLSETLNASQAESWDDWITAEYSHHSPVCFLWVYSPEGGIYDLYLGWYDEEEEEGNGSGTPVVEEGSALWYLLMVIPLIVAAGLALWVLTMRDWGLQTIVLAAVLIMIGIAFIVLIVRSIAGT